MLVKDESASQGESDRQREQSGNSSAERKDV